MLDRYEIGERQTSACAAPTEWLRNLGLGGLDPADVRLAAGAHAAGRQGPLAAAVHASRRSTIRSSATLLFEQAGEAEFETAKVSERTGQTVQHGPRRRDRAADRRRTRLAAGARRRATTSSRRTGRSRAASRCTRRAPATTSSCGSTRATSTPATAGRSRRATRCASASARSTRTTRSSSRRCGWSRTSQQQPDGYQGNWIPHRIRPAAEDGVFFAGDSAGHCLPLTAEGIRTAFYFGIALGRELRAVLEGRQDKAAALERYGAFSASHKWKFESMYAGPAVDPAPARPPAGQR